MNMKMHIVMAAAVAISASFAQDEAVVAEIQGGADVAENSQADEIASDDSVANANEDAGIEIDADAKVQEAFDAFEKSKGDDFPGWGRTDPKSGIIYYCART